MTSQQEISDAYDEEMVNLCIEVELEVNSIAEIRYYEDIETGALELSEDMQVEDNPCYSRSSPTPSWDIGFMVVRPFDRDYESDSECSVEISACSSPSPSIYSPERIYSPDALFGNVNLQPVESPFEDSGFVSYDVDL